MKQQQESNWPIAFLIYFTRRNGASKEAGEIRKLTGCYGIPWSESTMSATAAAAALLVGLLT